MIPDGVAPGIAAPLSSADGARLSENNAKPAANEGNRFMRVVRIAEERYR